MTIRVAVRAPEDMEWIRAGAGIAVEDELGSAQVVLCSAERAPEALGLPTGAPIVIIGEPGEQIDRRIAHVVRRGVPAEHLLVLLASLAGRRPTRPPAAQPDTPDAARNLQRAFAATRRLAGASNLIDAESAMVAATMELMGADRAHCLFHDPDDGALWSEARMRDGDDERRAIAGLAGFAARTGSMTVTERAGLDRRWYAAIDDPAGQPRDRLLAQPIIGCDGAVHTMLVAVRRSRRSAFSAADADLLAHYAALAAPFVDQLSCHRRAESVLSDAAGTAAEMLFRSEAIAAREEARWGDVIRVTPEWMDRAYWLLVALVVASAAYMIVGRIAVHSTGPAVIRATERVAVVARVAGNVTAVERTPGERVAAGAVIARLDDQNQRAALDRAERAFASQLRNHLLDPSDPVADSALRQLRQARDAARAALEERVVRAPAAATIADLRVHAGQHVEPGHIIATIGEGAGGLEVVALLPGEDRPQLGPGMTVRLELSGYRYAYQSFVIDSVSSDVIGPSEARRVLGAEVADSLDLVGPVVLVRGRLPEHVFDADGRTFSYHDGMLGIAEVRVREERILFGLVPGLKRM
jgi:membrane fusion protein (multidrug efflux system)